MEKSNRITASDIIQIMGLLLIGISIFGGFLFYSSDLVMAALKSIVLIGALYGLAYVMQRLKTAETNQSEMRIFEILTAAGFLMVALVSLYFYTHFINIEYDRKETIIEDLTTDIEEIPEMFDAYHKYVDERVTGYKTELKTINLNRNMARAKEHGLDRDGSNLKFLVDALTAKLKGGDYEDIRSKEKAFVSDGKGKIDTWNRSPFPSISLPLLIVKIDNRKKEYLNELTALSQGGKDGGEPFQYDLQKSDIDLSDPLAADTDWAVVIPTFAIVLLMTLWPYFFSARSDKGIIGKSGDQTGGTL